MQTTISEAKPRRAHGAVSIRNAPSAICRIIDRRTAESRRFEFLTREFSRGLDSSQATRTVVEAAALSTLRVEMLTARVIAGQAVDDTALTRATNAQSRAMRQLQALKTGKGKRGSRSIEDIMREMAEREAGQ
jgi:hypothetical protein